MDFRLEYVGPHGLHTPDGHKTKGEAFVADEHWVHGNAHLITGPHPLIVMRDADNLRSVQLSERAPAIYDHERKLREPGDTFLAPGRWLVTKCSLIRSGRLVEVEFTVEEMGGEPGEAVILGEGEYPEGAEELPIPQEQDADRIRKALDGDDYNTMRGLWAELSDESVGRPTKPETRAALEAILEGLEE